MEKHLCLKGKRVPEKEEGTIMLNLETEMSTVVKIKVLFPYVSFTTIKNCLPDRLLT